MTKFKKGDVVLDIRDGIEREVYIVRDRSKPLNVNSPDHIGIWHYLLIPIIPISPFKENDPYQFGKYAMEEDIVYPSLASRILYAKV